MEQKLNFPDFEKLRLTLEKLKDTDFSKISYQKIISIIKNEIVIIPISIAKIHEGYSIYRARINNNDEIFTSENEISYRTDYQNLNKYGRANIPHQSMFYGAFQSTEVEYPRIVNLFELSELFRNPNDLDGEVTLTIGKWRIKKEFQAIEMVFSKGNVQNNEDIKNAFEYQRNLMVKAYPEQINQIEKVLEYFSDEFAKKEINNHFDYMITAGYTNLALGQNGYLQGVTYPSVRMDYKANNIAIFPETVEHFLELEMVSMFKVYKKGKEAFMDNIAIAVDLGNYNSNFKWIDIQGKSIEEIDAIRKEYGR